MIPSPSGRIAMSQEDFIGALEQELQLRGVGFNRVDVLAFVASAWPLIQDDMDVARWANAFIDSEQIDLRA
jgi:hypothetical protein